MARLGRYFLPDQPLHVIQRGNNRDPVFFCEEYYERYSAWLAEAASRHGCAIHAYVLMTNHVHLLATPHEPSSVPHVMQSPGRREYVWFGDMPVALVTSGNLDFIHTDQFSLGNSRCVRRPRLSENSRQCFLDFWTIFP